MALFDRFKKSGPQDAGPPENPAPEARAEPAVPRESEGGGGLFARFRQGLKKTSALLNTDIRDLFKTEGRLVDDAFLDELFAILVRTDMGAGPANEVRDRIGHDFRARVVQLGDVLQGSDQHVPLPVWQLAVLAPETRLQ